MIILLSLIYRGREDNACWFLWLLNKNRKLCTPETDRRVGGRRNLLHSVNTRSEERFLRLLQVGRALPSRVRMNLFFCICVCLYAVWQEVERYVAQMLHSKCFIISGLVGMWALNKWCLCRRRSVESRMVYEKRKHVILAGLKIRWVGGGRDTAKDYQL